MTPRSAVTGFLFFATAAILLLLDGRRSRSLCDGCVIELPPVSIGVKTADGFIALTLDHPIDRGGLGLGTDSVEAGMRDGGIPERETADFKFRPLGIFAGRDGYMGVVEEFLVVPHGVLAVACGVPLFLILVRWARTFRRRSNRIAPLAPGGVAKEATAVSPVDAALHYAPPTHDDTHIGLGTLSLMVALCSLAVSGWIGWTLVQVRNDYDGGADWIDDLRSACAIGVGLLAGYALASVGLLVAAVFALRGSRRWRAWHRGYGWSVYLLIVLTAALWYFAREARFVDTAPLAIALCMMLAALYPIVLSGTIGSSRTAARPVKLRR